MYLGCDRYAYETNEDRYNQCVRWGGNNNGEKVVIPAEGSVFEPQGTCAMKPGQKFFTGCGLLYQNQKNCKNQCGQACPASNYQLVQTSR